MTSQPSFGQGAPKYPNVDALMYWNRVAELRNELFQSRQELGTAQDIALTKGALATMREKLFEKKAVSEEEYRRAIWEREEARFKIEEIKKKIFVQELYEQINQIHYEAAMGQKAEEIPVLAAYHAQLWQTRAELARIVVARIDAEIPYRDFQYSADEKLLEKGAVTQEEFIIVRDIRNDAYRRKLLAQQQLAHAEAAQKEASATR